MGANQLCRIVVGISSLIGRDGRPDMGQVSTDGKIIRNLLGSMKPPDSEHKDLFPFSLSEML